MRTCPEGAVVGPRLTACGPFGSLRTVIRVVPLFRDPDLCRESHSGIMLGFIDKTSHEPRSSRSCRSPIGRTYAERIYAAV